MTETFRPGLLVPHYNHHVQFAPTIARLESLDLPMIVVDDGSSEDSRAALRALLQPLPWAELVLHETNQGKGAAMITGVRHARDRGLSHVVQVDADGQHTLEDIPKLLAVAKDNPDAIVSARPVFGEDIPRERLVGRRITDFWVRVETWSGRVEDAMCGLRVYPVETTCRLVERRRMGRRMQFDTEVLVRADWAGIPLRFVPSPVSYPEGGLSHFQYWRDNRDLVLMHIGLVLEMLPRIPWLIWRHFRPPS